MESLDIRMAFCSCEFGEASFLNKQRCNACNIYIVDINEWFDICETKNRLKKIEFMAFVTKRCYSVIDVSYYFSSVNENLEKSLKLIDRLNSFQMTEYARYMIIKYLNTVFKR